MSPLKDITLGQYYPVHSFLHRLDPRTKLVALLITMSVMVATNSPAAFGIFFILFVLVSRLGKLPFTLVARNLRPFLWLFVLTFLLNLTYGYGRVLWRFPALHLTVTEEGLLRSVIYTFRIILLILFAGVFTLVTAPIEITDGLARLLRPLRHVGLPVSEFAMMTTIAIRFIPILLDEADRIKKAQLARGAQIEGNLIQRIKGIIPIILPLFLSAFRKADDLALAMEARCYQIGKERTSFKQLKMTVRDYAVLAGTIILSVGVLWI